MPEMSTEEFARIPRSDAFGDLVDQVVAEERTAEAEMREQERARRTLSIATKNYSAVSGSSILNGLCSVCEQPTLTGANFCLLCGAVFVHELRNLRSGVIELPKRR